MRGVFRPVGEKVAVSLDEVTGEMLRQGATGRECRGMARAVGLFLEWCGGMGVAADREGGIAWLRERRQGMVAEAFEEMKAGLTTWFHLTGQAKTKTGVGAALPGSGAGGIGGGEAQISQGGRVNGVAQTWQEAGARFKGNAVKGSEYLKYSTLTLVLF